MNSATSSPAVKGAIVCTIHMPDERTPHEITMKKTDNGFDLLEKAYFDLGVVERDYFGITFKDHSGCQRWLETHKSLAHQFNKLRNPITLKLEIKFYPNDPLHLKNEFSRYLLYRQIRQDIYENRIYVPEASIPRILGFLLQAEFADWTPELPDDYVEQVKFKPEPISKILKDQAISAHKTLSSMTVKEMEIQFVQEVANYASYGLDMYTCKDQEDAQLVVGIGCNGISTFAFGKVTHSFKWREVLKMYYEGKQFFATIRLRELKEEGEDPEQEKREQFKEQPSSDPQKEKCEDLDPHKHLCAFRCQSATQAKVMWKSAMERKTFFTAASSGENNRLEKRSALSLVLRRSTTFNFHGRVQREVIKDDIERESPFMRYTWASNTLPRMTKLQSTQMQPLMMTPSPSPSARQSATTLAASPSSEATMVETPLASPSPPAQPQPEPEQSQQQSSNADFYNTPPASPDLMTTEQPQSAAKTEDSGHLSGGSDVEVNATFSAVSLHSNFETDREFEMASCDKQAGGEEKSSTEQLRTYSTQEDDDLATITRETSAAASLPMARRGDDDKVVKSNYKKNEVAAEPPSSSTITANSIAAKTTCYHRSANAVPREAKSKKPQSSSSLVLTYLVAFVIMLILLVAFFEMPLAQLQQLPFYADLRHHYYEPLRMAVVPRLQKIFGGR